jgi:hypothetical protein
MLGRADEDEGIERPPGFVTDIEWDLGGCHPSKPETAVAANWKDLENEWTCPERAVSKNDEGGETERAHAQMTVGALKSHRTLEMVADVFLEAGTDGPHPRTKVDEIRATERLERNNNVKRNNNLARVRARWSGQRKKGIPN